MYACYRYTHDPEDNTLSNLVLYLRDVIDAFLPAQTLTLVFDV